MKPINKYVRNITLHCRVKKAINFHETLFIVPFKMGSAYQVEINVDFLNRLLNLKHLYLPILMAPKNVQTCQ